MPYWLESDTFHDDPRWGVLSKGAPALYDSLQAAFARLMSYASHQTTDGYLTAYDAQKQARPRVLDLLCTPVLGEPPLVHRQGDECPCLGEDWRADYDYRIHKFLKRNPSRAESDRNKAQRADLKDNRLKELVYQRDGGCCRYCRSGPLSAKSGKAIDRRKALHHDHVDPDQPAGADAANLVIACGRCNERKSRRTPDEAGLVLLDPPTPEEAAAWKARGRQLFDLPIEPVDQPHISDGSPIYHRSIGDPITDRITDIGGDPITPPIDNTTGEVGPDQHEHRSTSPPPWPEKGAGSGRVPAADPDRSPPPTRAKPDQPTRTPDAPDIYHRRSRSPRNPRDSP